MARPDAPPPRGTPPLPAIPKGGVVLTREHLTVAAATRSGLARASAVDDAAMAFSSSPGEAPVVLPRSSRTVVAAGVLAELARELASARRDRDVALAERDLATRDRDAAMRDRDASAADARAARDGFRRAHDAYVREAARRVDAEAEAAEAEDARGASAPPRKK